EIKDGDYQFADGFETNRYTLINSETPDTVSVLTDGNGNKFPTYAMNYDCIPASTMKPQIVVKNLVLSPYEGNPAEFEIEVIGGTNVRYQWQMISDDGIWSPCVDLADDAKYRGCRTNHFKMHTYFGDEFHVGLDWMNMRCKVTSDQGTFYSGLYWYSTVPRNVVPSATFTGITTPVVDAVPDRTVVAGDSEKYTVTGVDWLGPKTANGTYTYKLTGNEKFTAGTYKCRIKVAPTEKYKFDAATTATVDGKAASIVTIDGSEKNPMTGDTYIIEKEYVIKPDDQVIRNAQFEVTTAIVGRNPDEEAVVVAGEGFDVTDSCWSYYDKDYGNYFTFNWTQTYEKDITYRFDVELTAKSGYKFPENAEDMTVYINGQKATVGWYGHSTTKTTAHLVCKAIDPQFIVQPVGGKADIGTNSKTVSWEVNFTPVKAVLFTRSIQGDYIFRPVAEGADFTKASVHDLAQYIRVYYDNYNFVQSEAFYITQALDVFFTADSDPTVGGKVTVDIDRTVEQDDEWMEAYFDDAITYQWYRNYEAISGATGQSYTLTEDDAGEEISVTLTRTSDGKFLKSAKIAILSDEALLGDLNFDGTVNMMDALLLYGGMGGARTLTTEQKAVSDMNSDGAVNMMDALLLYKQASGA
ncbi:MAG: dockerin type I repeat-containing protein, partial [Clostridia bacterium]|nr:dockerin type I repeat-containing protein [Clostridia bacterium]